MGKNLIISVVGVIAIALGASAAGYLIRERQKTQNNSTPDSFINAGIPDESADTGVAQLENSKMVSEGSQFGVQYFNHAKNDPANK